MPTAVTTERLLIGALRQPTTETTLKLSVGFQDIGARLVSLQRNGECATTLPVYGCIGSTA